MEKRYKSYDPEQSFLFPPNLRDWLPEDHLAYFVSDVVDQLDLSAFEAVYEKDTRGQPPYNPRMMTKILLYKKEDCKLCDEAESILEKLKKERRFFLERITLEPNTDLFERFGNKVPVVFINDKMVFEFKLDEAAFLRKIAELE